jgi:MFS family permease
MILFLQFHQLSYTEIFFLYAVQSAVIFLLEIPSGVFADQFGKKSALIISRFSLIPAYSLFAFADNFWLFFAAMMFLALNKAFKSGTHKAYIFDYLQKKNPFMNPTEVFGRNKFWARLGEASASAAGGWIAAKLGFSFVFLFALVPAAVNFLNALTYEKIEEKHRIKRFSFPSQTQHIRASLSEIKGKKIIFRLIFNSAIFVFAMEASEKFFQPYMMQARIPVEWFGVIYMVILIATAFGSRYAYVLEKKFSRIQLANISGWLGVIPFFVLGFKFISAWGIIFFFVLLFLKSTRRPSIISELNRHISSEKRATVLSADSLLRALCLLAFLPAAGYLSDTFSIYTAMLTIGGLLVINQIIFSIPRSASPSQAIE